MTKDPLGSSFRAAPVGPSKKDTPQDSYAIPQASNNHLYEAKISLHLYYAPWPIESSDLSAYISSSRTLRLRVSLPVESPIHSQRMRIM